MAGYRGGSSTASSAGGGGGAAAAAFATRMLLLLTLLPLALAAFAFALQWRGGMRDPAGAAWPADTQRFPGMENSPLGSSSSSSHGGGGSYFAVSSSSSSPGADCAEILGRSAASSNGISLYRGWSFDSESSITPKICITGSTSAGLHQILPWLYYHKVIGVSHFFLFVEGEAAKPAVTSVLESIRGVKIIYRTKELKEKQDKSRIWNETWLSGFFYKPCNFELFVKQSLNMEMAIIMARDAGMDWIIHLDTDELIHPAGAREYSLRRLLLDVPDNVDMVIFPNYESSIERDDIKDPFTEVSMFKKNYDHLPKDTYFGLYKEATRGNPNYFLTYGNGKSAARVQEHLRPNGAHRWHNYMKSPNEIKLEEAAILHYTYTKFSDLTSRRDRCGCKPTKEDVKRCFILEFDRLALFKDKKPVKISKKNSAAVTKFLDELAKIDFPGAKVVSEAVAKSGTTPLSPAITFILDKVAPFIPEEPKAEPAAAEATSREVAVEEKEEAEPTAAAATEEAAPAPAETPSEPAAEEKKEEEKPAAEEAAPPAAAPEEK